MATIGKIDPKAQDADFEDVGVSQPFTADSSALTIAPQNEVSLAGGAAAIEPMNPMESLMEVFYEMRDSLNTLVEIATDSFSQGRDEQRGSGKCSPSHAKWSGNLTSVPPMHTVGEDGCSTTSSRLPDES